MHPNIAPCGLGVSMAPSHHDVWQVHQNMYSRFFCTLVKVWCVLGCVVFVFAYVALTVYVRFHKYVRMRMIAWAYARLPKVWVWYYVKYVLHWMQICYLLKGYSYLARTLLGCVNTPVGGRSKAGSSSSKSAHPWTFDSNLWLDNRLQPHAPTSPRSKPVC